MCSYFILNKALNLQLRNLLGTTCLLYVILTNCSQLPGKLHLHWPNKLSPCIFFPTEIVTVFTVWAHIHYQSVLLNLETPQKLCCSWLLPYAFPSCAAPCFTGFEVCFLKTGHPYPLLYWEFFCDPQWLSEQVRITYSDIQDMLISTMDVLTAT